MTIDMGAATRSAPLVGLQRAQLAELEKKTKTKRAAADADSEERNATIGDKRKLSNLRAARESAQDICVEVDRKTLSKKVSVGGHAVYLLLLRCDGFVWDKEVFCIASTHSSERESGVCSR